MTRFLRIVPTPSDDRLLVARLARGDDSAFDELYEAYAEILWRVARILSGNDETASEIVHDVFLWIWRNRETMEVHGRLRAYLFGAVRHRAQELARRAGIEDRLAAELDALNDFTEGVLPPGIGSPPRGPDEHALASLSHLERLLVLLRYRDRMSYDEIAPILGVSAGGARVQMSRVLRRLEPFLA
jgi:DNA-directed RNA polymerase specialized sigma24 family protein